MGDIVHTLPAISDLAEHYPNCEIHWLCEKNFAEIPALHPAVSRIITIEFRKWRKNLFKYYRDFYNAIKELRETKYDYIIDCQGLFKSALWVILARGKSYGYSYSSISEGWVSIFYNNTIKVAKNINKIKKNRELFQAIFGYEKISLNSLNKFNFNNLNINTVAFIHGTTWPSKKISIENWQKLAENLINKNINIKIPYYGPEEYQVAQKIAEIFNDKIEIIKIDSLSQVIDLIKNTDFVYGVDTGLTHLADYLKIPHIIFFGPTDPNVFASNNLNQKIIKSNFSCTICRKRKCYLNRNFNEQSLCMKNIILLET